VVEVGSDVHRIRVGDRVAIPFILSCGHCRECAWDRRQPTVCEDQHQPGFTMVRCFSKRYIVCEYSSILHSLHLLQIKHLDVSWGHSPSIAL
jgi:D-arabinose 1-dehydrogenase-like Zn-dependent alcohol dehydrogenase